jgi:hypothetical protein
MRISRKTTAPARDNGRLWPVPQMGSSSPATKKTFVVLASDLRRFLKQPVPKGF